MSDEDQVERATTFSASEAPGGERLDGSEAYSNYYKRLSELNSLRWNGKWSNTARENAIDRSATLDSVAGQLQLTDYQHDEAARIYQSLPTRIHEGYSTPLVAACVCGIVGREDGRDCHPHNIRATTPHTNFGEFLKDHGYSFTETFRCWEAISGARE